MAGQLGEGDIVKLSKIAFDGPHATSEGSVTALKAVANTLLLQEDSRQTFADAGYAAKVADSLRAHKNDFQAELIYSRMLFLLTYKTSFDFKSLLDKHDLIQSLQDNLNVHAERYAHDTNDEGVAPDSIESRALSETLKLIFNLNQFYPDRAASLQQLLEPMLKILAYAPLKQNPLQPPINFLVNALLNTQGDLPEKRNTVSAGPSALLFPQSAPSQYVVVLVNILDRAVRHYSEEALETAIVPLLTLLRRLVEIAPEPVTQRMAEMLLPSDTERDKPLGSSDTLASRLLKLSTAPAAIQVREGTSSLLFELSDKDPATFVRNVGYGYAAGFLMTHNIPLPEASLQEDVGDKVTNVDGMDINPVTGQRRDKEPPDPGLDMTDEEKEREAERLFVLFQRLKATGVMNVANPVEQAAREGRLEAVEASDSDSD